MAKEGIQKLVEPQVKNSINNDDYPIDEIINRFETKNVIYTT
jgi:hypothetical protein